MEYLKDYDFELLYHPGKANVVVDALSRKKSHVSVMLIKELELIEKLRDMNLGLDMETNHIQCSMLRITNEFLDEVRVEQGKDQELQHIISELGIEKRRDFRMGRDGILRFREDMYTQQSGIEENALG